jgi:Effector protein
MSIKIGSEPDDYFKPVSDILNVINRNPIGAVLITRLQQHKNIVAIYPMDEATAAKIGADNADTNPLEPEDSAPKGASERQQPYWYRGNPDNPATPSEDERYDMVPQLVGTGLGTHAMIKFSPENIKRKGVYDRRPDSVLFHELVHALRIMQGQRNPIPTEEIKWMNEEEFLAVAITNVYLSAGGSTRLRGGYGDYDRKLAAPEDTSSGFLKTENLKLFDKLARFEGPMFTDFGFVVVARFNPFREWLRLRMA